MKSNLLQADGENRGKQMNARRNCFVASALLLIVSPTSVLADSVLGDFNGNGQRDPADVDLMTDQMLSHPPDLAFDLNGDQLVDFEDRRIWAEELSNTYIGDSNFDGEFNSGDFVSIFAAAKYETGLPATWAEGDWNGDRRFQSSDFVCAFSCGAYEIGPRVGGLQVVPEPAVGSAWCLVLIAFTLRRREYLPRV